MKKRRPNGAKTEQVILGLMLISASLFARPMDLRSSNLENAHVQRAPTLLVPVGADRLLSRNCAVTSSTLTPEVGELAYITDGNKDAAANDADNMVKLGTGLQWVQLDLGSTQNVYGVCIWRHHHLPRIYRDVVVQLSNDASFTNAVTTIFNNDHDNSSGFGMGNDKEYIEWNMGRCIPVAGIAARYVRVYSNGRYLEGGVLEADSANYYTEVEIYGGTPSSQETTVLAIDIPRPEFL